MFTTKNRYSGYQRSHGRACPGHPDYLAPSLMIGVAGTSPAMTRFQVLIQKRRIPL
jgi:hypothetical protein